MKNLEWGITHNIVGLTAKECYPYPIIPSKDFSKNMLMTKKQRIAQKKLEISLLNQLNK
jgi:hypothetical protein